MRRVFVLTGKRGGFGAMKPMLRRMLEHPEIELILAVTDQHLNQDFGYTVTEIRKEFEVHIEIDLHQKGSLPLDRAISLGTCVQGVSKALEDTKPDICVLYGDRGEVLAAALAATTIGIPIAHIQGGDVSGSLDEQMRHAITKLSHLHYTSNKWSSLNIEKMGEENWRIINVGDCHIDEIMRGNFYSRDKVISELGIKMGKKIGILLQHSETTEPEQSYSQMQITLEALKRLNMQLIAIRPCSDSGYEGIVRALDEYKNLLDIKIYSNLEAPLFWGLQSIADIFIGNSSAGIIESTCFRLPTINIGRRQNNRIAAKNIIHVGHDKELISNAINYALNDVNYQKQVKECENYYGEGNAGRQIADHIAEIEINSKLKLKTLSYGLPTVLA